MKDQNGSTKNWTQSFWRQLESILQFGLQEADWLGWASLVRVALSQCASLSEPWDVGQELLSDHGDPALFLFSASSRGEFELVDSLRQLNVKALTIIQALLGSSIQNRMPVIVILSRTVFQVNTPIGIRSPSLGTQPYVSPVAVTVSSCREHGLFPTMLPLPSYTFSYHSGTAGTASPPFPCSSFC